MLEEKVSTFRLTSLFRPLPGVIIRTLMLHSVSSPHVETHSEAEQALFVRPQLAWNSRSSCITRVYKTLKVEGLESLEDHTKDKPQCPNATPETRLATCTLRSTASSCVNDQK